MEKPIPGGGFVSAKEAAALLRVSQPTLRNRARLDPAFPKPRKISPRKTVYLESEIASFLSNLPHGL
ncbi:TPA: AlpA family phage regulatory protein [Burkholderia vietnamiensis]|nr:MULTISPECIES: AlpA family phage regulatory protein [Burkholderia cepacia complex]MBR7909114.1 AlpA family phage regulatory protein [Burkholderia vietnamiensis]HDR9274780.1 AlpA family phage regulatory protein [Burkholderia vietnamiensis]